ncbi:MAG: CopD family protein [bacterium]|nr:CopD family protein [bacterium]
MNVVFQWVHLFAAALAVGGVVFLRFVLLPSVQDLQEAERKAFMDRVLKRFKVVLHASIGLLLLSGMYNMLVVAMHGGLTVAAYLHVLLTKVFLVLILFTIAILLTVPGEAFAGMKANRKKWLAINTVLGAVVLFLSAYLRRM